MWILWLIAIILWCVNLGGAIYRENIGSTPSWGEVIRADILIIILQVDLLINSI